MLFEDCNCKQTFGSSSEVENLSRSTTFAKVSRSDSESGRTIASDRRLSERREGRPQQPKPEKIKTVLIKFSNQNHTITSRNDDLARRTMMACQACLNIFSLLEALRKILNVRADKEECRLPQSLPHALSLFAIRCGQFSNFEECWHIRRHVCRGRHWPAFSSHFVKRSDHFVAAIVLHHRA